MQVEVQEAQQGQGVLEDQVVQPLAAQVGLEDQ